MADCWSGLVWPEFDPFPMMLQGFYCWQDFTNTDSLTFFGSDLIMEPFGAFLWVCANFEIEREGEQSELKSSVVEKAQAKSIGYLSAKFRHITPPGNVRTYKKICISDLAAWEATLRSVVLLYVIGKGAMSDPSFDLAEDILRVDVYGSSWPCANLWLQLEDHVEQLVW